MNNISPFYFNKENSFIYNIKFYNNFKKFCVSYNDNKPTKNEILFLKNNIANLEYSLLENRKK